MRINKNDEEKVIKITVSFWDIMTVVTAVAMVVFLIWAVWPRHNEEGIEAQLTSCWSNIHLSDRAVETVNEKDFMFFPADGSSPSFVGEHAEDLCVQFESSARNENGEFFTVYYVDVK